MENKQTAVEWFYQRILAKDIKEVFEQAKQIEKEQMKEAYLIADHYPRAYEFEKYYKETYQTK